MNEPDPMAKMTFPWYVPAPSFAPRFEAVTVTVVVAPPLKVLPVGLTISHFVPLSVSVVAVQVPNAPQLVIATVCVGGSLTPAIPVKLSVVGVAFTQPACTVKVMPNVCGVLPG